MSQILLELSNSWINCIKLENSLNALDEIKFKNCSDFIITIPENCKLMVDAGVRLLSYLNQLSYKGINIKLIFSEGEDGTFGYMNRIGFFDYLDNNIETIPIRPWFSRSEMLRGTNKKVFEIFPLNPNQEINDSELPSKLTDQLLTNIKSSEHKMALETPCYTLFAELIENIFLHSQSKLNSFIAFQVYEGGGSIKVAVSDSGIGLLSSLRESINLHYPKYTDLKDSKLIELMFSEGLSKDGPDKGCGLRTCAMHALKFKASIDVRLNNSCFHLTPVNKRFFGYNALGSIRDNKICFDGTHITVDIRIDK